MAVIQTLGIPIAGHVTGTGIRLRVESQILPKVFPNTDFPIFFSIRFYTRYLPQWRSSDIICDDSNADVAVKY